MSDILTTAVPWLLDSVPGTGPASLSVLGPRRLGVSHWFVREDGGVVPIHARLRPERFFRRAREGRACATARQRLDAAVQAYAFAGTPSEATDLLVDVYLAVNDWRDCLAAQTGPAATFATGAGTISLALDARA